jgi:hypothetical protein
MCGLRQTSRLAKWQTITYFERCPDAPVITVKQSLTLADVRQSTRRDDTLNLKSSSNAFNFDGGTVNFRKQFLRTGRAGATRAPHLAVAVAPISVRPTANPHDVTASAQEV